MSAANKTNSMPTHITGRVKHAREVGVYCLLVLVSIFYPSSVTHPHHMARCGMLGNSSLIRCRVLFRLAMNGKWWNRIRSRGDGW